jgi:transposase
LFQEHRDNFAYNDWANQFKSKVQSVIAQWIGKAGGETGKVLRSLQDKAHQWW